MKPGCAARKDRSRCDGLHCLTLRHGVKHRPCLICRTAVYGPVCTVVWEGRSREAPPYPYFLPGSVRGSSEGVGRSKIGTSTSPSRAPLRVKFSMSAWKTRNLLPRWKPGSGRWRAFSVRLRIDSTVEGPRGAITSKYERYKSALLTREIQILVSYSSGILTSAAAGIQVPKCIGRGLQTAFLQCRPLTTSLRDIKRESAVIDG